MMWGLGVDSEPLKMHSCQAAASDVNTELFLTAAF